METSTPSFSPGRKWSIGFNVILSIVAVLAVLLGVNYLSNRYFFHRFYLSTNTRVELSPRTVALLHSLTNRVQITLYYDKQEPLYSDIISLLREYETHSSKLAIKTVDYYRDPGAAQEVKLKYDLGSTTNKDFIIFDAGGRKIVVDGNRLSAYRYDLQKSDDPGDQKMYVNRKRVAFNGELLFSSALFALSQAQPLKAYFVLGHGEHSPDDTGEFEGYSKLAEVFHRNYVQTITVTNLLGTNAIPLDCNLLVVAAPRTELSDPELEKISQYLDQGGRMLMMFRASTQDRTTGLENILAKWNVVLSPGSVRDPSASSSGLDLQVFDLRPHDITKSLIGLTVVMVTPHAVGLVKQSSASTADEPHVTNLAFSSASSYLSDDATMRRHPYPLMVAIEKGAVKGVVTERGTTRMLVLGDSYFLDNQMIDVGANRDFADAAVNWLLDRTTLLQGVGPRPVAEYRLTLVNSQVQTLEWILLAAIPGGVLVFGGLVWLRRRK